MIPRPEERNEAGWRFLTSYLLPALVVLLALALNLYRLESKSLWHDEFGTLTLAGLDGSWTDALVHPLTVPTLPKPPLSFFVTRVFFVLGQTDFSVRLPSVVFATLTIPLTYALGKALFGRQVGLLGALLLAVAPLQIRYAQEARMYAMLSFFSVLSLYCFWWAMRTGRGRWWLGFAAASALNLYVHQFALLPLGVMALFALWLCIRPAAGSLFRFRCWQWLAAMVAVALLYLPMVPFFVEGLTSEEGLGGSAAPVHGELQWDINSLGATFRLYSGGSNLGLAVYAAFLTLGVADVVVRQWRNRRSKDDDPGGLSATPKQPYAAYATALAIVWVLLPLFITISIPAGHGVRIRYLIFSLPVYLLLVALGFMVAAGWLRSRREGVTASVAPRTALVLMLAVVFLGVLAATNSPGIRSYYAETKQNWRDAVGMVQSLADPGEALFVSRYHHRTGALFYAAQWTGGKNWLDSETVRVLPKDPTDIVLAPGSERAWIIVPIREKYKLGGEYDLSARPLYQLTSPITLDPTFVPQDSLLIAPISYRSLAVMELVRIQPPFTRFWSEDGSIQSGDCTWLHWETEHVKDVYLDGTGVAGNDKQLVCPTATTSYELQVVHGDSTVSQETLVVTVEP